MAKQILLYATGEAVGLASACAGQLRALGLKARAVDATLLDVAQLDRGEVIVADDSCHERVAAAYPGVQVAHPAQFDPLVIAELLNKPAAQAELDSTAAPAKAAKSGKAK
jgi:hypothetical protein